MPNTAPPVDQKTTNIFTAVKEGNIDKLKEYIKNKGDINIKYDNGRTLLHEAVLFTGGDQHSSTEKRNMTKDFADHRNTVATSMVKALLEANANPNTIDEFGNGPLIYAIARSIGNYIKIPKMLLEKGADANEIGYVRGNEAGGNSGLGFNKSLPFAEKTPLILALTNNKLYKNATRELMQLLCKKGANTLSLYEFLEEAKEYVSGGAGGGAGGIAGGGAGGGAGGIAGGGASRKIAGELSLKLNYLSSILPELKETYPNTKFTDYDIKGALETICEKVDNKVGNKSKVASEPGPKSTPPSKSYLQNQVSSLQNQVSSLQAQVEALQCVTALLLDIIAQTPQNQSEIESSSEGPSKKQKTVDRNSNSDPQNQGEEQGGRAATSLQASGARQDAPTQSQDMEQIPTEATMRLSNPPASTRTRDRSNTPPLEQVKNLDKRLRD